jgi:hypothetical protein
VSSTAPYARTHAPDQPSPRRARVAAPAGICRMRDRRAGAGCRREHRDLYAGADDRPPSPAAPRAASPPRLQHRPCRHRPSAALAAGCRRLRGIEPYARGHRLLLRVERQPDRQRRGRAAHRRPRLSELLRCDRYRCAAWPGYPARRRAAGGGSAEPRHVAAPVWRTNRRHRVAARAQRQHLHHRRRAAFRFRFAGPRRRPGGPLFAGRRCPPRQPRPGIPASDREIEGRNL